METEKMYLTINEFASMTGLSRTFIRQCCKNGTIPTIRIGNGVNKTYMVHVEKALSALERMLESEGKYEEM